MKTEEYIPLGIGMLMSPYPLPPEEPQRGVGEFHHQKIRAARKRQKAARKAQRRA